MSSIKEKAIIIDWNSAPEGATHYDCRPFVSPAFMRKNHNGFDWEFFGNGHWVVYGPIQPSEATKLIERPDSWSGIGSPPVGTLVDIHPGKWRIREESKCFLDSPVIVAAAFKMAETGTEMIAVDGGRGRGCECFRAECAKPVPTPKQIAAELREKTVQQMLSAVTFTNQSNREIFRQLYDLGYRKFEITDDSDPA